MSNAVDARFQKVVCYLEENFNSPLRLDELSRICAMSKHDFEVAFVNTFSQTPHQFLTNLRLDKARDLLSNGLNTVDEACHKTGFESLFHFSSNFRRKWGLSPEVFLSKVSPRF